MTPANLDTFTRAYIECALWSSTIVPFGECPQCGKPDRVLCRWQEQELFWNGSDWQMGKYGVHVCSDCSTREPNYEPPADENYSIDAIADETLERIIADCERFQHDNSNLLEPENQTGFDPDTMSHVRGHSDVYERAGHDFWLTRNGHGAGFWDGDWKEPAARKLTEASKRFGGCDLYVGDDGRLYI